jgi:hypothetical protein
VKKKQAATNWRKRALEAEKQWCEALADRNMKAISLTGEIRRNEDLRGQIEVGDQLIAQQRERLIRLTRIAELGNSLALAVRGMWHQGNPSVCRAYELGGTLWIKEHGITQVANARNVYEAAVAALLVDTALPLKEKL